ncbi:MAG: hypothetical protein AAGA21_02605 [Pseudomonadota bacterium]
MIIAACLTLTKMALIALDLNERDLSAWLEAQSQQASAAFTPPPGTPDDSRFVPWPTSLPEPAAGPNDRGNDAGMSPGDSNPLGARASSGDPTMAFDPSTLTDGQIQALRELMARRQELEERERLLDIRTELNGKTEERLDQQITRLADLKERIEALITDLDDAEEQKLARLVKIYETMKPKAAAEIFNRLEIPILLHVVERMKEAKSAVVLGRMDPVVAKRVTTELAKRQERPKLSDQNFGN